MLIANVYGRLGADPVERATKAGSLMVTASLAVDVTGKDAEGETLWVSLLAFGTAADALMRAGRGEMVAALGRMTRGRYTGRDGTERERWTLLADAVITARSARPSSGKRAQQSKPGPETATAPFDDDALSF